MFQKKMRFSPIAHAGWNCEGLQPNVKIIDYNYCVYGLNILSAIECPQLPPGNGAIDVIVRFGPVPERLGSPVAQGRFHQVSQGQFLLTIENTARFLVRKGIEIVIDRISEAADCEIRGFLLGSVLGALMHQRGVLPLHASVIGTERGAIAFSGNSGEGKSTLAAAFYQQGYSVIADDVCAVLLDAEGKPMVMPGYAQLNLCMAALKKLGIDKKVGHCGCWSSEKYEQSVSGNFSTLPAPLSAIYELNTSEDAPLSLTPVLGREKVWMVRDNTFRRSFLRGMGQDKEYMRMIMATAQSIRCMRVNRPQRSFLLDELMHLIQVDLDASA